MPFSVSVTPRVSVEGDGVTISAHGTGGDADAEVVEVGYTGSSSDSSAGNTADFTPSAGDYTCYADFTIGGGSSHRETGPNFVVSEET